MASYNQTRTFFSLPGRLEPVNVASTATGEARINNLEQYPPPKPAIPQKISETCEVAAAVDKPLEPSQRTPLHRAVLKGRLAKVRALFRAGANPRSQDRSGNTPLHLALLVGREVTAAVIANADAENDLQNERGRTPLHVAADCGYIDVVKILLRAGTNTRSQDGSGNTPLHLALLAGREATAAVIADADAENDERNGRGRTPLHVAAMRGSVRVARKLLYSGVRPDSLDDEAKSALEMAVEREHLNIVLLILSIYTLQSKIIPWHKVVGDELMPVGACVQMVLACKEDVSQLKETRVGDSWVTYHDVATRGTDRVAKWLAQEGVRRALLGADFKGRLKVHARLIAHRVDAAHRRKDLNDRCLSLLSRQLPLLPLMTIEHILSFLSERERQCLIDAFPSFTVGIYSSDLL